MEEVCKMFYISLFKSRAVVAPPSLESEGEKVPSILIERALKLMNKGKVPGKNGITSEMIQVGGEQLWKILALRFNRYLEEGSIPSQWKVSNRILNYKRGDKEYLKNYRPICLPSHIYKLFPKIIAERLSQQIDEQQPREQAGFRKMYSTIDHIFTLTQLLE
eukprot:XP_014767906.1 PREDICTED: RNA-directed DNA polymerase from mobile element jockey-like [Octopus bimaculoides]